MLRHGRFEAVVRLRPIDEFGGDQRFNLNCGSFSEGALGEFDPGEGRAVYTSLIDPRLKHPPFAAPGRPP